MIPKRQLNHYGKVEDLEKRIDENSKSFTESVDEKVGSIDK